MAEQKPQGLAGISDMSPSEWTESLHGKPYVAPGSKETNVQTEAATTVEETPQTTPTPLRRPAPGSLEEIMTRQDEEEERARAQAAREAVFDVNAITKAANDAAMQDEAAIREENAQRQTKKFMVHIQEKTAARAAANQMLHEEKSPSLGRKVLNLFRRTPKK